MANRKIFYPILQLTASEHILSLMPTNRFFPYITVPSVVEVIKTYKNVAEVRFPILDKTDIVSVDFLHETDSPEVNVLTKQVKEQERERRSKGC